MMARCQEPLVQDHVCAVSGASGMRVWACVITLRFAIDGSDTVHAIHRGGLLIGTRGHPLSARDWPVNTDGGTAVRQEVPPE